MGGPEPSDVGGLPLDRAELASGLRGEARATLLARPTVILSRHLGALIGAEAVSRRFGALSKARGGL
jgi:hypothetical protein